MAEQDLDSTFYRTKKKKIMMYATYVIPHISNRVWTFFENYSLSEFAENAFLCPLFCGSVQKNPWKCFFYKNSEYYLPNLANANYIKLIAIANSYS